MTVEGRHRRAGLNNNGRSNALGAELQRAVRQTRHPQRGTFS